MSKVLPPYPRFGECIAVLAGALDIRKTGSDVGRLSREGDFDWEKLDGVIQDLLIDGSTWVIGHSAQRIIAPWLSDVRDRYTCLVLDVPLDAVSRSDALPILVEEFFVPVAANLLQRANCAMPGPDLRVLLDEGLAPVSVTIEWLDGLMNAPIEKVLYPASTGPDRVNQEKVRKWRTGVDVPSSQGIKLLSQSMQSLHGDAEKSSAAALWLTLASALTRLERVWDKSLRSLVIQHLGVLKVRTELTQSCLTALVQRVGNTWPELAEPGRKLWHDLMRTSPKQSGAQDRTWHEIVALQAQAKTSDQEDRTAYHYEWMKGRWHVLSGQYQESLLHYEKAFDLACYRAGHQVKDLISEASCIAAFLGKKTFLKRLKHVGIALGLFRKPDTADVLEDWESDQFAQQLLMRFPAQGRFFECEQDLSERPTLGLMSLSEETITKIKPDLKTPARVRAVQFESGETRRWPQLRLFASFGMVPQVKALLEVGASVDDLDSTGGSALLCALQYAKATGERDVLDLLLAQPHEFATLNAATQKKHLTPLMCAIDLGLPDVVRALLDQKVDVEKRALTDTQSPLYYLTSQLFHALNPHLIAKTLVTKLLQEPDLVQQDTLRRFGVRLAGTFGSEIPALRANPDLVIAVIKHMVNEHVERHEFTKLMEIAELLLDAGADPNAVHQYPVPGRTPLMLAAESDLPELFDLMVRHGGNPFQSDADGQDCRRIAMAFGSRRVLNCLQQTTY